MSSLRSQATFTAPEEDSKPGTIAEPDVDQPTTTDADEQALVTDTTAEGTASGEAEAEAAGNSAAPGNVPILDMAAYDATKAALDANAAALQHHQAVVAAAAAHHVAAMQMLTGSATMDDVTTNSAGKKMVNHYYIDFSLVTPADVEGDAPMRGEPIGAVLTSGIAAQIGGSAVPPAPIETNMVSLGIQKKGREIRTFPMKLMEILCRQEISHIISWLPHGRSFLVHNPDKLCSEVLPKFLKPIKFTSFTRQLQLWGFKRITKAPDHGAYYHQLFLRGKVHLLKRMHVTKVKGSGKKLTSNPQQEPDFYSLSRLRPLPDTTTRSEAHHHANVDSTAASAMRSAMAAASAGNNTASLNNLFGRNPNAAYMQQAAMFLPHTAAFPYMNPLMGLPGMDPMAAQTQLAQMMLAQQALMSAQTQQQGSMQGIQPEGQQIMDAATTSMEEAVIEDSGENVIKVEEPEAVEELTANDFLEASEV